MSRQEREYEVKCILGSRYTQDGTQYLVQWVDWDEPTWEPEANMTHADKRIKEFWGADYPRMQWAVRVGMFAN